MLPQTPIKISNNSEEESNIMPSDLPSHPNTFLPVPSSLNHSWGSQILFSGDAVSVVDKLQYYYSKRSQDKSLKIQCGLVLDSLPAQPLQLGYLKVARLSQLVGGLEWVLCNVNSIGNNELLGMTRPTAVAYTYSRPKDSPTIFGYYREYLELCIQTDIKYPTDEEIADILEGAADRLLVDGWCQGALHAPNIFTLPSRVPTTIFEE